MRKLWNFLKPGVGGNAYIAGAIIAYASFELGWLYAISAYLIGVAFCIRSRSLQLAEQAKNYKDGYFDGQHIGYSEGYDDGYDDGYDKWGLNNER